MAIVLRVGEIVGAVLVVDGVDGVAPIGQSAVVVAPSGREDIGETYLEIVENVVIHAEVVAALGIVVLDIHAPVAEVVGAEDRKSTRLNSSHANISYAVFCLKKKKRNI